MNDEPTGLLKYKFLIDGEWFYCNKFVEWKDSYDVVLYDAYPQSTNYSSAPVTVKVKGDYTHYELPDNLKFQPLYWENMEQPIREMAGEK